MAPGNSGGRKQSKRLGFFKRRGQGAQDVEAGELDLDDGNAGDGEGRGGAAATGRSVREFQPPVSVNLTDDFAALRQKKIGLTSIAELEKSRLLMRLSKLLTVASLGKEAEKTIVSWQPDKAASECHVCGETLTLLSRKHHCRLCGQVVCIKPTCFVELGELQSRQILHAACPKAFEAPSEHVSCVCGWCEAAELTGGVCRHS
jgi:hypothetical protein